MNNIIPYAGGLTPQIKALTNREAIIAHLESGGQTPLTEYQQKLLERWQRADELQRKSNGKKNKEEIANMLQAIYKYSRATAFRDIVDAEIVFSTSKPINSKYTIGIEIEAIKKRIAYAVSIGDSKMEISLRDTLLAYIKEYPQTVDGESPKVINFIFDNRQFADQIIEDTECDIILGEAINELPDGE